MQRSLKSLLSFILAGFYLLLAAFAFRLLAKSHSAAALGTPWQTINGAYILVFLFLTLLLGLLLSFAKLRTRWLLPLLMVHGLVLYSYLPLTHSGLYGADGWRHFGDMQRILAGNTWRDVSSGGGSGFLNALGIISYSGFWGVVVLVAKLVRVELIDVLRWLQPVLTAVLLPLISFYTARSIGLTRRLSLLSAWYMFLPFALQAVGAFTLPVSFWFLLFGGALVFLLKEFNREAPRRKIIALLFVVLCFGYSLYPALFALAWILAEIIRIQNIKQLSGKLGIGVALCLALVIPVIERLQAGSSFVAFGSMPAALKQIVGNIFGIYLATGPRDHVIPTGNIFFNQAPAYAFVSNFLIAWRWWIVVLMFIILGAAILGAFRLYKYGNNAPQFLALFGLMVSCSYVIGRYFIVGGQIMTRRMDAVVAFVLIYFVLASIEWFIETMEQQNRSFVPFVVVFVLIGSLAISASYSLGPTAKTISDDHIKAMRQIAADEAGMPRHCVISDTYSLTALEAFSGKRIVGGGFPINADFSQPELDIVRANLAQNGSDSYKDISYALSITGAKRCWYVGENGFARIVGSVE